MFIDCDDEADDERLNMARYSLRCQRLRSDNEIWLPITALLDLYSLYLFDVHYRLTKHSFESSEGVK